MLDSVRFSDLSLSSFTSTTLSYSSHVLQFYILCQNTWEPASKKEKLSELIPPHPGNLNSGNPGRIMPFCRAATSWDWRKKQYQSCAESFLGLGGGSRGKYGLRPFFVTNFWKPKDHPQKIWAYIESTPQKMMVTWLEDLAEILFGRSKAYFQGQNCCWFND